MTNLPRFTLTFPEELLDAVDAYQKETGISTRSKAIHELVMAGITDIIKNGVPKNGLNEATAELLAAIEPLGEDDVRALTNIAKRMGGNLPTP